MILSNYFEILDEHEDFYIISTRLYHHSLHDSVLIDNQVNIEAPGLNVSSTLAITGLIKDTKISGILDLIME